jgi:F-type H+-transporting ATPase subunit delta
MSEVSVARRYAVAMIEVAAAEKAVDQVGDDLRNFHDILQANDGQLQNTLCTPLFSADERTAVLQEILPKLGLHKLSVNFVKLVNAKGRLPAMGRIAEMYGDLADEMAGRVKVRVTTAEPMSAQIEAEVRAAMEASTGKSVLLNTDVDPELIGGMVARVGGKVYDSSVRTRLRSIKQTLLNAQSPGQA